MCQFVNCNADVKTNNRGDTIKGTNLICSSCHSLSIWQISKEVKNCRVTKCFNSKPSTMSKAHSCTPNSIKSQSEIRKSK